MDARSNDDGFQGRYDKAEVWCSPQLTEPASFQLEHLLTHSIFSFFFFLIVQNLELRQKDNCVSFQCHAGALPNEACPSIITLKKCTFL